MRSPQYTDLRTYSTVHRVCAALLGLAGMYWALLLLSMLLIPQFGVPLNVLSLPSWMLFFGWWYMALGRSVEVGTRLFWIISALVNLIHYLLHLAPWLSYSSVRLSLNVAGVWWLLAFAVSTLCALLRPVQPVKPGAAASSPGPDPDKQAAL